MGDTRYLSEHLEPDIFIFFDELGDKLSPHLLTVLGLHECLYDLLEQTGPDTAVGSGDVCNVLFQEAHAQCKSSDLISIQVSAVQPNESPDIIALT